MSFFSWVRSKFQLPLMLRDQQVRLVDRITPVPQNIRMVGASHDRFTNLFGSNLKPANAVLRESLKTLVARSRELYQNNTHYKRFLKLLKINVVGPVGFKYQSNCRNPNTKKSDKPANEAWEAARERWEKSTDCDYYGEMNFIQMVNAVLNSLVVDGEYFIIPHLNFPNEWGFTLELVDAQLCPHDLNRDLGGGRKISAGIELDPQGRKVAIYFMKTDRARDSYYNGLLSEYTRVPIANVWHKFEITFIGQLRGIPVGQEMYKHAHNVNGYVDAAIVSARVQACQSGFFEQSGNDVDEEFQGDADLLDEDGNATGDFMLEAEPGVFRKIPRGLKFSNFTPNTNPQDFTAFMKAMIRNYATGFNVEYSGLSGDYEGVNYNSLRMESIVTRDFYKTFQEDLKAKFLTPVSDLWIEMCYLKGTVKVNGADLKKPVDYYMNYTLQGRRWMWVDPVKEIDAHEKALSLRLQSRSAIIRERGDDPETVFAEIAAEEALLKEHKLEPVLQLYNQTQNAKPKDSASGDASDSAPGADSKSGKNK